MGGCKEERVGGGRVRSRDSGPVGSEVGRGRCSPGGPGSRPWLVCLGTLLWGCAIPGEGLPGLSEGEDTTQATPFPADHWPPPSVYVRE